MKHARFSGKFRMPKFQIPMKHGKRNMHLGFGLLGLIWRLVFGVWDFSAISARATVITLALLAGGTMYAQRVPPHLGFVYPAGGQQGTTFTVSVGGQSLNGATATYFSGAGVQAKVTGYERPLTQKEINDLREKVQQLQEKRAAARSKPNAPAFTPDDEKLLEQSRATLATRGNRTTNPALAETVTLQVTVAPDATPGTRELRVKTETGLSNPVIFCVGTLAEATDPVVVGSANRSARPNATTAPRAAEPTFAESTVSLPVTINGQILPGEVDRFRFAARKGQRLTLTVAARALMPYLADAVPGWFQPTLALYDSKGAEVAYADDFRFHPDPVLLCEIPGDGEYVVEIKDAIFRGREDFVYRLAIGELPFVTAIFPLGGRAGEDLRVQTSGWNLHRNELVIDTMGRGRGAFELAVREGTSLSNTVRFAMDEHAAALEAEPNDSVAQAQAVVLPLTIDGRIAVAGDADVFQFEAHAPGVVVAEVVARRLNSPLDSVLELFDRSGQRLAMNDDYEDKGAGLLTHHADSRLEVTLPSAGTYFVRVTDAQRHGGPEFGYRLRLGPREPDFALRIVPSTINVRAGSTVTLTAYALRRDGFDGEIVLGLKDPSRGFFVGGGRIPARAESVRVTLTAPPTLSDEPQSLSFVGVATVEGKRVGHLAVPADDLMQAFAYHHLVPSQDLKVQMIGRGSTLRVATRMPVTMVPGGLTRIRISTPQARSVGEVKLELIEPPPGIAVLRCDRGVDYVDVTLSCDPTKTKPGTQGNLLFNAIGERNGGSAKQGKGAAKLQRSQLGTVPAIPFDVVATDRST
jgi:hypothetical protein